MKTVQLTKSEFQTKISNYENYPADWMYLGDKPAVIDFYADWCPPCRAIAPVLEELASEYIDQVYFYKVNTDQEEELATVFNIRSIPTLLFIPLQGNPQVSQGAFPKKTIKELIEKNLFF